MSHILLPDGTPLPHWLAPTPEMVAERERLLRATYFLVRQGTLGEIFRCRECKGKHDYFTLRCVEQPFSGLTRGLFAFFKAVGDSGADTFMNPAERARYRRLSAHFEPLASVPDLASSHPRTARLLATPVGDADVGGLALGILEPIPQSLAQRYLDRINGRGGRLAVPGLRGP